MTERTGFYYIELQELVKGQPFAGMAAGVFVDMGGRTVELSADDIQLFVDNTNALIVEYQGRGMPGLPIDARKHDKGDAAGWLTGAAVGSVTSSAMEVIPIVNVTAEWTSLGVELLAGRLMTNFSPTIDLDNKVIRGGSLTNWPATVDAKGVPLFAAVELAQGMYGMEAVTMANEPTQGTLFEDKRGHNIMTTELTNEQLEEMVNSRVEAQLAELNASLPASLAEALGATGDVTNITELAELIRNQEQVRWQAQLAEMRRGTQYAELATRLTGGTPDQPRGIPAQADALRDELLKLTPEQATFWSGLLEATVKSGLTEFSEIGHSARGNVKRAVPDYAVRSLKASIAAGNAPELFFEMAGLGSAADYDLSPYEEI